MITGDNKNTAVAVAQELGMLDRGGVLTGAEIQSMSDEDFENLKICITIEREKT
jgi:P-type Ca2+ transporter type 2C